MDGSGKIEAAPAIALAPPSFRAKAISYVTSGGVIAGVVGPTLARWTPRC